jgi:citrate lyase subunit beta/citryl-CoA lyase
MSARTYLFVPGNRPERFAKALASGADAVVLDLEDAVVTQAKDEARDAISRWATAATQPERDRVLVRINDSAADGFADDLRLLRDAKLSGVMLPKADSAEPIRRLAGSVPGVRVLALIESARGIAEVHAVATSPAVVRLILGTLDFALDLDLDIADSNEALAYAASRLVLASRLAGLDQPVAGVTAQIEDEARLQSDWAWARRHGFGAKLCIHPRQIAAVHRALSPSPQELDWARRVLASDAASPGAAQLDGRMIDRPVVLKAQRTLQRANT